MYISCLLCQVPSNSGRAVQRHGGMERVVELCPNKQYRSFLLICFFDWTHVGHENQSPLSVVGFGS